MNIQDENLINKIVYLMKTDDSIDAPGDSVKWAKNIFRAHSVQPKKSIVQKVLATLQINLSPNTAVFGERSSASAAKARQMLFQAGDNAVDLRIGKSGKNFALRGQVLGGGFANCDVKLGNFAAIANELSEFSLFDVPTGRYDLTLRSGSAEITIKNLEIK